MFISQFGPLNQATFLYAISQDDYYILDNEYYRNTIFYYITNLDISMCTKQV